MQTQATGPKLERPDIAFRNEEDVEHLLIEAKFGALLTNNQPLGYLRRCPREEQVVLLFVAPERRLTYLWQELIERVNDSEEFCAEEIVTSDELHGANVSSHRILMLTGWHALLGRIASSVADNSPVAEDTRQLQGLVSEEDDRTYRPMPELLSIGDQEWIPQLERLVYDVIERGKENGWASTKGYRTSDMERGL